MNCHVPVNIRPVEQVDLPFIVEADRALNNRHINDPDFGEFDIVNPWALTQDAILAIIRSRRTKESYDTRTMVACLAPKTRAGDVLLTKSLPCGALAYEKREEGIFLPYLTAHPAYHFNEVVTAMLKHIKLRVQNSSRLKTATLFLRDRDEAGLRQFVPLLFAEGFSVKLARGHFGDHDGWECSYRAKI